MANALATTQAFSGNANSLANGAYASLGVIDFTAAPPGECFVEFSAQASSTPSATGQVLVFMRTSLDGTNYSDAPSSTLQMNAIFIGKWALPDTSAHRSRSWALSPHLGGGLVQKAEIYLFNDTGVALAASGQVGQYRFETFG